MEPSQRPSSLPTVPAIVSEVLSSPGQAIDATTIALLGPHLRPWTRRARPSTVPVRSGHAQVGATHDAEEGQADQVAGIAGERGPSLEAPPPTDRYRLEAIRVHTDGRAARSALLLGAQAYALGDHIAFGASRYDPDSAAGRRLITHELVHALAEPASAGPSVLRRQEAPGPAADLYTALGSGAFADAVRALTEMSQEDRRAALAALSPEMRLHLRTVASELDPSPTNLVSLDIDAVEQAAPQETPQQDKPQPRVAATPEQEAGATAGAAGAAPVTAGAPTAGPSSDPTSLGALQVQAKSVNGPPSIAPAVPAPAPGMSAPPAPVPPTSVTADENAPVQLPREGPLVVTFSSARQLDFEVNDLSEFGLGEGVLETPEIPVGEFITVKAAIGSDNPITLRRPTLTLDPVIGSISAAEIGKYRADVASSHATRTTLGAIAAGVGGIVGGLGGLGASGVLGAAGVQATGVPRWAAEQGGLAAGRTMDTLYDFFHGDFDVTARLDQGQVHGELELHYTPFLRLTLGAAGLQWLARLSAELQTAMNLTARATIALSGSSVVLHFGNGELVRTVFTVAPAALLGVDLVAQARLKLAGSFLNILEESAGRDESLLSGEITTDPFPLFSIGGAIGAQTWFTFAKGSPMEILDHHLTATEGATRERFIAGLRASGPQIPLLKRRAPLDEKSRTGLTEADAIVMAWHKPAEWYPPYLTWLSASGRDLKIPKFPNKWYEGPGLWLGVDDWPYIGKKLMYRGGEEREGGVGRFRRELQEADIIVEDQLAYQADIDHVIDWAFGGPDDESNLWPLERTANRSAGTTQNRFQKVWWAPKADEQPRRTKIEEVPIGRYFEIGSIRPPRR